MNFSHCEWQHRSTQCARATSHTSLGVSCQLAGAKASPKLQPSSLLTPQHLFCSLSSCETDTKTPHLHGRTSKEQKYDRMTDSSEAAVLLAHPLLPEEAAMWFIKKLLTITERLITDHSHHSLCTFLETIRHHYPWTRTSWWQKQYPFSKLSLRAPPNREWFLRKLCTYYPHVNTSLGFIMTNVIIVDSKWIIHDWLLLLMPLAFDMFSTLPTKCLW